MDNLILAFVTLMDVRSLATQTVLQELNALHVNMRTTSTASLPEFVSTYQTDVMDILTQAVVGMMKVFITATNNTTAGGLSKDTPH